MILEFYGKEGIMMAEEMMKLETPEVPVTLLQFNAQAAVTFTLVGTNLVALYRKEGTNNTFLVIPTDKASNGGMSIKKMIDDINSFLKGYDPGAVQLDPAEVAQAVKDVDEASRKETTDQEILPAADFDYESITVELRQAFLYLKTGQPVEYAFELDVDTSSLFPKEMTFFNVKKLSMGVWNTDRETILARMGIIDFDTYLGTE